jgi:hypothetical protein
MCRLQRLILSIKAKTIPFQNGVDSFLHGTLCLVLEPEGQFFFWKKKGVKKALWIGSSLTGQLEYFFCSADIENINKLKI